MKPKVICTIEEFRLAIFRAGFEYGLKCSDEFNARIETEYGMDMIHEMSNDGFVEWQNATSEIDFDFRETLERPVGL